MLSKLCGGGDTPWVTFRCIFMNRSSDVTVDHTDSGNGGAEEEEEKDWEVKNCCCFAWRRRRRRQPRNENAPATTMTNVVNAHE
jgi:hypothetical protein